jgi:hypothetical protein
MGVYPQSDKFLWGDSQERLFTCRFTRNMMCGGIRHPQNRATRALCYQEHGLKFRNVLQDVSPIDEIIIGSSGTIGKAF